MRIIINWVDNLFHLNFQNIQIVRIFKLSEYSENNFFNLVVCIILWGGLKYFGWVCFKNFTDRLKILGTYNIFFHLFFSTLIEYMYCIYISFIYNRCYISWLASKVIQEHDAVSHCSVSMGCFRLWSI